MVPAGASEFRVTALRWEGTQVKVTWQSSPGASYTLLQRSDLLPGGWQPVATGIPATDQVTTFTHNINPTDPMGFYRVQLE